MIQVARTRVFVDGNNVMGPRPNGWWRDRAGAARRLVTEIIPLARGRGGDWTIVFNGIEPPHMPFSPECFTVVNTVHGRRDAADDRIVELVHEHPNREASLVYTSDAKLPTRLQALGTRVMGSGTLLKQIATVSDPMQPDAAGHTPGSLDGTDEGDSMQPKSQRRNRRASDRMHHRSPESRVIKINGAGRRRGVFRRSV